MNVLISAIGGDVACAVLRSIKDSSICSKIVGFDIRMNIQGRKYVDVFLTSPPYICEREYKEFLSKVIINEKIDSFLPMTEYEIKWADKNRDFFADKGVKLVINNSKIISIAGSKLETALFLSTNGFDVPKTMALTEITDKEEILKQIGVPFILKMDEGCGSKNIKIIKDTETLNRIDLTEYVGYIVQEYISNEENEYTVGVFSDGRKINSIIFKRRLGFGGMSTEVKTIKDDSITETVHRLAELLELKGAINVQLRKDRDKNFIFEINPRLSSTVGFRNLLGFKDAMWWLQMINNEEVKMEVDIQEGIIGIKTLDEMLLK